MFSTFLSLFTSLPGALQKVLPGAALVFILIFPAFMWQCSRLDAEIERHDRTKASLAAEQAARASERQEAIAALAALKAQVGAAAKTLAEYQEEEAARADIMQGATIAPRNPEKAGKVVDDATRAKAADFLNSW